MVNFDVIKNIPIKLNSQDVKRFGQVYREYLNNPNQKLKMEIVDIFAPQIERKAAAASVNSNGKISAVDFAQDLYLKLLENLETAADNNKYVANYLSGILNKTKPNADTLVTYGRKTAEELSAKEFNELSYSVEDKTLLQKAYEIVNYPGNSLNQKRIQVMEKFLEGKGLSEIAVEMDLSHQRVCQIYDSCIRRLNVPKIKNKLSETFFDDINVMGKVIPADSPFFEIPKKP